MMKISLTFLFGITFLSCFYKQVRVVERISATVIEPGYYISENDSTFEFKHHRFLVKTKEFFDENGVISRVAIRKSEGYLEFPRMEFMKLKNFLRDRGFSENLELSIIDDRNIRLKES